MRAKKPGLQGVVRAFEAWRAKRRGRLVPEELWQAALELLDRYSSSSICRHLRLNPARFKQARESRGVGASGGRRGGTKPRAPRGGLRPRTALRQARLAPNGRAFVELPALSGGGGIVGPRVREVAPGRRACRLVLESDSGMLTVVTATPSQGLIDALCRFVLGTLGAGAQA